MNFDFKLSPKISEIMQEKQEEDNARIEKENHRLAELQKKKALRNAMQSTVLTQLANTQPRNPNAGVAPTPSVDSKQGW